jgi:hypothetical protein
VSDRDPIQDVLAKHGFASHVFGKTAGAKPAAVVALPAGSTSTSPQARDAGAVGQPKDIRSDPESPVQAVERRTAAAAEKIRTARDGIDQLEASGKIDSGKARRLRAAASAVTDGVAAAAGDQIRAITVADSEARHRQQTQLPRSTDFLDLGVAQSPGQTGPIGRSSP